MQQSQAEQESKEIGKESIFVNEYKDNKTLILECFRFLFEKIYFWGVILALTASIVGYIHTLLPLTTKVNNSTHMYFNTTNVWFMLEVAKIFMIQAIIVTQIKALTNIPLAHILKICITVFIITLIIYILLWYYNAILWIWWYLIDGPSITIIFFITWLMNAIMISYQHNDISFKVSLKTIYLPCILLSLLDSICCNIIIRIYLNSNKYQKLIIRGVVWPLLADICLIISEQITLNIPIKNIGLRCHIIFVFLNDFIINGRALIADAGNQTDIIILIVLHSIKEIAFHRWSYTFCYIRFHLKNTFLCIVVVKMCIMV